MIEDMEEENIITEQSSITARLNKVINSIAHDGTINISDCEYDEIRNFMYLWNLFENKFFNKNYDYTLPDDFKHLAIDQRVIEDTLNYFKSRYKDDTTFRKLHLRVNDNSEQVRDVFNEVRISAEDKLQVINTVIYRYRCNLFHGTKEIQLLWKQKDNFINANKYMLACLEAKLNIK
jgi:hypothetical protein